MKKYHEAHPVRYAELMVKMPEVKSWVNNVTATAKDYKVWLDLKTLLQLESRIDKRKTNNLRALCEYMDLESEPTETDIIKFIRRLTDRDFTGSVSLNSPTFRKYVKALDPKLYLLLRRASFNNRQVAELKHLISIYSEENIMQQLAKSVTYDFGVNLISNISLSTLMQAVRVSDDKYLVYLRNPDMGAWIEHNYLGRKLPDGIIPSELPDTLKGKSVGSVKKFYESSMWSGKETVFGELPRLVMSANSVIVHTAIQFTALYLFELCRDSRFDLLLGKHGNFLLSIDKSLSLLEVNNSIREAQYASMPAGWSVPPLDVSQVEGKILTEEETLKNTAVAVKKILDVLSPDGWIDKN